MAATRKNILPDSERHVVTKFLVHQIKVGRKITKMRLLYCEKCKNYIVLYVVMKPQILT